MIRMTILYDHIIWAILYGLNKFHINFLIKIIYFHLKQLIDFDFWMTYFFRFRFIGRFPCFLLDGPPSVIIDQSPAVSSSEISSLNTNSSFWKLWTGTKTLTGPVSKVSHCQKLIFAPTAFNQLHFRFLWRWSSIFW